MTKRRRGQQARGQQLTKHQDYENTRNRRYDEKAGCDYNGNTGGSQLPFKKRCENLLRLIRKRGTNGVQNGWLCQKVVNRLVADELVFIQRKKFGGNTGRTFVIATEFEELQEDTRVEPFSKRNQELFDAGLRFRGQNQGTKRVDDFHTKKWTQADQDKLLLDVLRGTAEPEVLNQVKRTKTRPKKIRVKK